MSLWSTGRSRPGSKARTGLKEIGSQDAAEALEKSVRAGQFTVEAVDEKERAKSPPPPFTTSSLQQVANRALGFPAKKTMGTAQKLYEGVELGEKGTVALITYMRTDSVRIADEASSAAREFILGHYGEKYAPTKVKAHKSKGGAQDAHEACRPVDVALTPDAVKAFLPADQFKLYQLIWRRFVASQMSDARFHDTTVTVKNGKTLWRAKGERLLFPGFLKVQGLEAPDPDAVAEDGSEQLPKLTNAEALKLLELTSEQKFTQPPPRYTEATLVKALEEQGIGRPSTYAAIISTLQDREYVAMEEKRFAPSELGTTVSDKLVAHFATLMDIGFTAGMERKLDEIAAGSRAWATVIEEFMADFIPALKLAGAEMERATIDSGVSCDLCGKPMHVKFGKMGEFLGCSGYPECKNTKPLGDDGTPQQPKVTDEKCPTCGKPLAVKRGRFGEFFGCTGYPECKFIKNIEKKTGVTCPQCNKGDIVEKRSRRGRIFYSCNRYPECKFALWSKPTGEKCPESGDLLVYAAKGKVRCSSKECKFEKTVDA